MRSGRPGAAREVLFGDGNRPPEQVALHGRHAERGERVGLPARLDAFRCRDHAEAVGERHNRFHDRGLLTAALAVPLSTEAQLVLDVGALAHARWPNTLGELRVEVIDLGGVLGLLRAEVQLDVWERDGRLDTWKPILKGQPAGTREGALVSLLEALAALDLADSVDPRDGMAF